MQVINEQVRTIRLYGSLGARFGRIHRIATMSASEAIRALCFQVPGFEKELMHSKDRGIAYAVFLGKRNINEDQLDAPSGSNDIRVAPMIQGRKSGIFTVIIGAALIAASLMLPGSGALLGVAYSTITSVGVGLGISLALGGITQMLTKTSPGLSTADNADSRASHVFNGPVNTTVQGNPVPLLYGRMKIGSAVLSAGIYTDDQV